MSDIGTCDTCHWFDVPARDDLVCPRDYGYCLSPAFVLASQPYAKDYRELTDAGALVENGEGWGMYVGPKFGCVHWMLPIVAEEVKP